MRSATLPTLPLGLILGTTALVLTLAVPQARADILNVTANVGADCSVQTGTLSFGSYDPDNHKNVDGSFTVTCNVDAALTIALDKGAAWDGSSRNVANGGGFIQYSLYQDTARSITWGDDVDLTSKRVVNIEGGDVPRTVQVYGRLLAAGPKPAGPYSDAVNITFTVN